MQSVVAAAWALQDAAQSAAAWEAIRPLVVAGVASPHLGRLYARVALALGQEEEAIAFLERLLRSNQIAPQEVGGVHLAAASLLDRLGAYDRAFQHARSGKEASRVAYQRADFTKWTDAQIAYFSRAKLQQLSKASHRNRRPVFIIGMPRSGTSLVEQILASHPQVHGAGELQALMNVRRAVPEARWAQGTVYPFCLDAMGMEQANELAAIYLASISALEPEATYVTDKMPTNFMLLGLIATLFPDSHVIHCRRDPRDTCLSCFMTEFVPGLPFTHALTDLGDFYRNYHRLMAHWKAEVGCPMIEIRYEDLIRDVEGETRRLLEGMGLPWDERCLSFHTHQRPVGTASRDQVRRPIYSGSVGRWRHYEQHLAELIRALGPAALG